MIIYRDGEHLLFQIDENTLSEVISTLLKFCKNDVVKITLYKEQYLVYIDNCETAVEQKIIGVFKNLGIYEDTINLQGVVNTPIPKEIYNPINMKDISSKRRFRLFDMGKLSGLTPSQAIEQYGEYAFLQLLSNFDFFDEYEKPHISQACREYVLSHFANTKATYLTEEELKHIFHTYQYVCKEQIDSILNEAGYLSLDQFVSEGNLSLFRAAYTAIQNYLLNLVKF